MDIFAERQKRNTCIAKMLELFNKSGIKEGPALFGIAGSSVATLKSISIPHFKLTGGCLSILYDALYAIADFKEIESLEFDSVAGQWLFVLTDLKIR